VDSCLSPGGIDPCCAAVAAWPVSVAVRIAHTVFDHGPLGIRWPTATMAKRCLFLFDFDAVWSEVNPHPFRLLTILIKLVPHDNDDDRQRSNNQEQNVAACHAVGSFLQLGLVDIRNKKAPAVGGPRRGKYRSILETAYRSTLVPAAALIACLGSVCPVFPKAKAPQIRAGLGERRRGLGGWGLRRPLVG
jgi:hypothetical protein